jgi:septum formation topological specificity factor MinE
MENPDKLIENSTKTIEEKVQIILRQTNYSSELAMEKLKEMNYDHLLVIKDYFGITEKKALPITSINQEIYRQFRYKLDSNMRDYHKRVETGEAKKIV